MARSGKRWQGLGGVVNTYGRRKMAGEVFLFAGQTPPAGSLLCNGAAVSRTVYANLFAAIGVWYGAGDGATTFYLPDYRGEFPRFADVGRGVDAARVVGSAQGGQVESHAHAQATRGGGVGAFIEGIGNLGSAEFIDYLPYTPTANFGGNETRPRNIALLPCIYY